MLNVDYYASLDLWQENHIYPSADGVSVFIRNITEKKKLELELHDQQKKEQQRMIAVAIEAQEKERNAIAAELHDNVNQILVGTKVMLSVVRDHPEKAATMLQQCMDNLSDAINENRKIAHELVSPDLRTESLVNQLTDLAAMMLQPAGIEFSLQDEALREELLNEQRKLAVYRVAQEQCTNIVKYAKAGLVVMTLGTEYDQLLFRVTDDGVGADPAKTYKGIGLQNIRNRIAVFGGTVLVNTAKGEGFELEINMPI
jgi:signal transduction histidine kinase